jgi:hypothetical protein
MQWLAFEKVVPLDFSPPPIEEIDIYGESDESKVFSTTIPIHLERPTRESPYIL